jgi:hypothetical protein
LAQDAGAWPRLIGGVNFLDELPERLRKRALLMDCVPSGATFEDAETLALHARLVRGTVEFNDFVYAAMR